MVVLMLAGQCAGTASDLPPATVEVGLRLSFEQKPPASFLKSLQREVEEILTPAGLKLHWREGPFGETSLNDAVELELRGACRHDAFGSRGLVSGGRVVLGWTRVVNGSVQPEAVVECDRIAGVMGVMAREVRHPALLARLHVRLAARVTAHELMHALLRTPAHHFGFRDERPLRPSDLLEPVRLEPAQIAALRRISNRRRSLVAQDSQLTPHAPASAPPVS
jgi:hypothetical protein